MSTGINLIIPRRLLAGWKRLAGTLTLMDYGPYDHVTDRLRALETRVAELEARQASTSVPSPGDGKA